MPTAVQGPIALTLPAHGIWVAESIHGPGFRMGPERHDFHQIYIVQRGRILLEDGRLPAPRTLDAGSLWAIPAGVAHRMEDRAESTLLLVCVAESRIQNTPDRTALWCALTADPPRPLVPDAALFSHILTSLNRVLAEQWQRPPGFETAIAAELDQLLVRLLRMPEDAPVNTARERVRRVATQLDTRFYEPWDIDRAADQAHLSRRRFTTLFREHTGLSFNAYLTRARLEHAQALLQGGHHSIAGAAFAAGIGDVSQFYRLFKKNTGTTPGAWVGRGGSDRSD